jgi:hypothetical protein
MITRYLSFDIVKMIYVGSGQNLTYIYKHGTYFYRYFIVLMDMLIMYLYAMVIIYL